MLSVNIPYLKIIYEKAKKKILCAMRSVNESPIFVIGNQKSGTTVIAALLSKCCEISSTLDVSCMHNASVIERLYSDPSRLRRFVYENPLPFSRELIKEPGLTFLYPALTTQFPGACFVMVVRDPRGNIRSILDRHEIPGDLDSPNEAHLDGVNPAWKQVLDGSWMGLKGDTYIDMLAARWRKAAQIYLENRQQVELICYEDFCADKVGSIKDLAERVDLPQKNCIEHEVDTQYQSRGSNRGVDWEEFFGTENLARIESRCVYEMRALSYEDFRTLGS